ncbi:MAG: hypothetical protein CL878_04475 [Dehalococcoidia bacterium]|nr:hypothetical protein [Dehalococcoidia bacterium]
MMTSAAVLEPVAQGGWLSGFVNLLSQENGRWWRTRRWLLQSLIWLVILNGILALILWMPGVTVNAGDGPVTGEQRADVGLQAFIQFMGAFAPLGAMILAQGAIVGEKQLGTAAWVLSKPVSRSAFIIAKLLATALGLLITVIALQSVIGYAQLSLRMEEALPPLAYVAAIGVLALHLVFYLALTLMLGTFFSGRAPVIGIAIAVLFGHDPVGQLLARYAEWLPQFLPLRLVGIAVPLVQEQPLPDNWPITLLAVAVYTVIVVAVALWRFEREEF